MKSGIRAAGIVFILISLLASALPLTVIVAENYTDSEVTVDSRSNSRYTSHKPIKITGNNEFKIHFDGITSGSGTLSDPYIISSWDIDASSDAGITIENTTVYLIINDCYIHNGETGILFMNVTNGKIINNRIDSNDNGITFGGSGKGTIESSHNLIKNNSIINNNNYGIYFENLNGTYHNHNEISYNNISSNKLGITLNASDSNRIKYNDFYSNLGFAVRLNSSSSGEINQVNHNNFINNNQGSIQASNTGGTNNWNETKGGNYWSDYTSRYKTATNDGYRWNQTYNVDGFGAEGDEQPLVERVNTSLQNYPDYRVFNGRTGKGYFGITEAVSDASAGDTIRVWSGTYLTSVNLNKRLKLIGNGSDDTIISSENIPFSSTVGTSADGCYIAGFNITGGWGDFHSGIYIYSKNNVIENCTLYQNSNGIIIDLNDNLVKNCRVIDNTFRGVMTWHSSNNIILDSYFSSNGAATSFETGENNTVRNCTSVSDSRGITSFGSQKNFVFGNTVTKSSEHPIYFLGSSNNYIYNNEIKDNSYGFLINYESNDNQIYQNNIIRNNKVGDQAIDDGLNNKWNNATVGNYWSDWTTPDNDGNGIVDNPYNIKGDAGAKDLYPLAKKINFNNKLPGAAIIKINPKPALFGQNISFEGSGTDEDGYITGYKWESSINGVLNYNSSFISSNLSVGNHSISFSVIDNDGAWSKPVSTNLEVKLPSFSENNITIFLTLNETEYFPGDRISGTLAIYNNNSIDVNLIGINDINNATSAYGRHLLIQPEEEGPVIEGLTDVIMTPVVVKSKVVFLVNFKIMEFSRSDLGSFDKLSPGKYSMHANFFNGGFPPYDPQPAKINSNTIVFSIKQSAPEVENIKIDLKLNKYEFNISEPVKGSITFTNNNSVDIELNNYETEAKSLLFYLSSKSNNEQYQSDYDHKMPLLVKANNNLILNFELNRFVESTNDPAKNHFTDLHPGYYSLNTYVSFGNGSDFEKIYSNDVELRIIHDVISSAENITFTLKLGKTEYFHGEPISGTVEIINQNIYNIIISSVIRDVDEDIKVCFYINYVDVNRNFEADHADLNDPVEINSGSKFSFNFTLYNFIDSEQNNIKITLTELALGNYSAESIIMFSIPYDSYIMKSNSVDFKIIANESGIAGEDDEKPDSPFVPKETSRVFALSAVATISLIIIILSSVALFIGGTEVGKYTFFSTMSPLYSKQRKKRDMEFGYIKGSVRGYILGNPGENYNSIKRVLNLPNGTLAYHLKDLEKEGIVKSERDGTYKRFYPAEGIITSELLELSDIQNDIYNTIMDNPGLSQKDIQSRLDISQQRLNYQIQQMADARLIRVERDGKRTKCFVIDESRR